MFTWSSKNLIKLCKNLFFKPRKIKGQLTQAISSYRKEIDRNPSISPIIYRKMGDALQRLGKFDEAITAYKKAVKLDANNYDFQLRLANLCCEKGDFVQAINSYKNAIINIKPEDEFWLYKKLALLLHLQEKVDEANTLLKSAKHIQNQSLVLANLDVIICSYGGVGTTFFTNFLQNYKSVNDKDDRDGLKHINTPPQKISQSNFKAIYIHGNPFNAVISLFRRNYQYPQSCKLLSDYVNIAPIIPGYTLDEYLEQGVDRLKLEQHFQNWSHPKVSYPIMLIKYELIWQYLNEIFKFLEIPESDIQKFPPRQQRKSLDWKSLPQDTQTQLYKMYGKVYEQYRNFDDIKIIEPNLV